MQDYNYFVALLTATKLEFNSVMYLYDNWRELSFDNDAQTYYVTEFEKDGRLHKVVTTLQNSMGMTAAATLSMKIIEHFHPRYLIEVGIAAGTAREDVDEQLYGDVIVADEVWDYSTGKLVNKKNAPIMYGNIGFLPRPSVIRLSPELRKIVENATKDEKNEYHVHIGTIATGSYVVANREFLDKQIYTQYRHTAGLDMEAYGVMYAAENSMQPKPEALIIKSVSDYADDEKSDLYQKFAGYNSSAFAKFLYENYLPF